MSWPVSTGQLCWPLPTQVASFTGATGLPIPSSELCHRCGQDSYTAKPGLKTTEGGAGTSPLEVTHKGGSRRQPISAHNTWGPAWRPRALMQNWIWTRYCDAIPGRRL